MKNQFNKKILIVDDMSSMRVVVKAVLKTSGYLNTTEASNADSALDKLNSSNFDLVICDWDMPGMSGLELLTAIRSTRGMKALPFILLTGNKDREKVKQAISAGTNDFITKPFQTSRLIEKVKKVLS